mmetsp:Transcript_33999/g.81015  ORF Transcript_33999/g.81015 Transcript_33999/m.81015 type:complete len:119 (+) Transcript_33999:419-775(+)|eukprot:CAMPEP_0177691554 /NCGR_PEP_ID=MMETSP0484_2-20121128/1375_1 /TAXON_ID=354590 /ORGANISM="Rhodomonas lens, Strain RHODO" /LENGTH=118 /DNA_ID=CAMNT_0019202199 /DNA_START=422 /DNA_END=778 /DNA_ORIENTATION=-
MPTGDYNTTLLAQEKAKLAKRKKKLQCKRSVRPSLRNTEERVLRESGALQLLDGMIVLEGLEHQGHCKTGGAVGKFGDCQHYCMPGIPDQFALALYNIIVTTTSRPLNASRPLDQRAP